MRIALLLFLLLPLRLLAVTPYDPETHPISPVSAALDNTGQLWVASSYGGGDVPGEVYEHLAVLSGTDWHFVPFTPAERTKPFDLARFQDGHIVCLWGGPALYLTEHFGSSSKLIASIASPMNGFRFPQMAVDSKDDIWVTATRGQIVRVTRQGATDCAYTVPADQFFTADNIPPGRAYNDICATDDSAGHVWFWGHAWAHNFVTMRGIVLFDGTSFVSHPKISGLPENGMFTCMYNAGPGKMRAGVEGAGLFEIDAATMRATLLPDPTGGALKHLQRTFTAGDATWYVTGAFIDAALWREQGGKWNKVLDHLDANTFLDIVNRRPYVATEKGILLTAYGGSPWFIPADQSLPVRVGWNAGFPLINITTMLRLPDGRFFLATNSQEFFLGNLDLFPREEPGRVRPLKVQNILFDPNGHGWCIFPASTGTLSEWDGAAWITHSIPNPEAGACDQLLLDSLNRIWLLPAFGHQALNFYDPAAGRWQSFASMELAVQSTLSEPPAYSLPGVSRTKEGRLCFVQNYLAHYFDGKAWHWWICFQIRHKRGFEFDRLRFDSSGELVLEFQNERWQLTAPGTWQDMSGASARPPARPTPPPWPKAKVAALLSQKLVSPDIWSCARDSSGIVWYPQGGHLFKARGDLSAQAFQPGEPDPFSDSRWVDSAQVDCRGNTFLKTIQFHEEEYFMIPATPVPSPTITLTAIEGETVTAQFSARRHTLTHVGSSSQIMPYYSWRLDDGEWTAPAAEEWLTIQAKENEPHTLEINAMDARLNISATPGVLHFKTDPADRKNVLEAIDRLLNGDDKARKAALGTLSQLPAIALPALKTARSQPANAGQSRVLEAAIQQIGQELQPPGH